MTGRGRERNRGRERYGFDAKIAERIFEDYRDHRRRKPKRTSVLDELFG